MLITKFNRMIKNRVVWGVIAVVVSIAFVAGYSNSEGCSRAERRRGMAGSLNGKNVPLRTFYDMRRYTIGVQDRKLTDEDLEGLDGRTWRRLAALETARELGLSPSDEEVGQVIRQEFAPDGAFDRAVYERWLQERGLPRGFFEEWMRQEVTLQKLTTILSASVWVPPAELEPEIAQRTYGR